MRKVLFAALCVGLLTFPVFAHGGQYKGPGDAGGNTGGGGGSVNPPTNPGGATAPGPGAPPGRSSVGTVGRGTTGGRSVRGESDRGKATTGSTEISGPGYEIWEFWWENNKDPFLNLKGRMIKTSNVSGSVGVLTGRGRKSDAGTSRRPSAAQIATDVVPAFLELMKASTDRDILDSTVLALGRIGRPETAAEIIEAARPLLRHGELSVRSSATLALGVLGSDASLELLNEILSDSSKGRTAVGQSQVSDLVRAFAALAMGLIDTPEAIDTLTNTINSLTDADKDIKVCSIVALGLMENDDSPRAIEFLTKKLGDRKLDQTIRSYIPTSLGKLAHPGNTAVVDALLSTFSNKDTENLVRQSAAIALGRLATTSNGEVIEVLSDYIEEGKDMQTRHFAFISLAKIGARDETPDERADVHKQLINLFTNEMSSRKASAKTNRSWAAIAGALYGRTHADAQVEIVDRLKTGYDDEKNPSYKSAYAVALGLMNVRDMGEQIFDDFNSSQDQDLKGYCAVALGLMRYVEAADALRGLVQNKTITPTFRLQTATGLGLMGDEQAVDVLIDTLQAAETLGVSSAVAKALGLIGDKQAIAPLKDLAANKDKTKLTRAFACVALGIVGEKTELPWNTRISEDNNYRARVPAIDEVLDIL